MVLQKKHKEAIHYMVYTDMKDVEIARTLQVDPAMVCRWRKNDEFAAELQKETEKYFKGMVTKATKTAVELMNNASSESVRLNAAKIFLDKSFADKEDVKVSGTTIDVTIKE